MVGRTTRPVCATHTGRYAMSAPKQLLVQQNALEHQQVQQLVLNNPCFLVCLKIHIGSQKEMEIGKQVVELYQAQEQEQGTKEYGDDGHGDDGGGARNEDYDLDLVEELDLVNQYFLHYSRNVEEKRKDVFALLYQIQYDLGQGFLQKNSELFEPTPSTLAGRAADSQLQV
ncbi:hypothetical protein B296_00045953 [Ensete ventricosum]|uniref:Uncharacterized protein n=1 Tax=Ensete ventricosum TaxID=4639 RepID=A0A426Z5N8_ENSVE|nr:hypothetical protein B296_00045953 [Ensete ventricosum]